jgi:hypothetical protein
MELDPTAKLPIKIVTVGDHLVGKSCAITTYQLANQVLLPLKLPSSANQQYSTVQIAKSKSKVLPTTCQFGTKYLSKGYHWE